MEWIKSIRKVRQEFKDDEDSINAFSKIDLDPNVYNPLMNSAPVIFLLS